MLFRSHVGIVVQQGDTLCVVHAVPYEGEEDRVVMEPVWQFFSSSNAVAGMVLRSECRSVAQAAARHAVRVCCLVIRGFVPAICSVLLKMLRFAASL